MPCCDFFFFLSWLCSKPSPPSSEHNLFLHVRQDQVEQTVPRREYVSSENNVLLFSERRRGKKIVPCREYNPQLLAPHQRFQSTRSSQQSKQAIPETYWTTCDSGPTPQMKRISIQKVEDWMSSVDATGDAEFDPVPKSFDPKI